MTRKTKYAVGITLTALALGLGGCAGSTAPAKGSQENTGMTSILTGKVAETMDGGGYTYILLDQNGKKTWVAIPASKVTVGQDIKLLPGAEMPNFSSRALNRTFDMVIFSGGIYKEKGAKDAAEAATKAAPQSQAVLSGKVVETIPAANYTYLLLEKDGKRGWSAIPTANVKVGDQVELIPGMDMGQFKSATLNRTFDNIHFSAGLKGGEEKQAKLPEGHPKLDAVNADAPAAKAETGAAAAKASAAPAAPAADITGKVVETTNAGGYTYLCLEKDGKRTWAAVPAMQVKVGQELTLPMGNVMTNFTSKSLNRTFEKIIFTNGPK